MPRISRTAVKFTVDGEDFVASFSHKHYDPPVRLEGGPKVQHITTCKLLKNNLDKDTNTFRCYGEGTANCSVRDEYNWRAGIKLAFGRAVSQLVTYRHPEIAVLSLEAKSGACKSARKGWGLFHQAFFSEMRVDGAVAELHHKEGLTGSASLKQNA